MDRREFIKMCAALGVTGGSLATLLAACERNSSSVMEKPEESEPGDTEAVKRFTAGVVIIGAGAAGITAGYLLEKMGTPFAIIEANDRHGGRLKKLSGFVDYPIDLGGEWIHIHRRVLNELSGKPDAQKRAEEYRPMTAALWDGKRLYNENSSARAWRGEYRFKSSTWYDFFNDIMVPSIRSKIVYKRPALSVDYRGDRVRVRTADQKTYVSKHVIVTAPLKILQEGRLSFAPPLPRDKQQALKQAVMPMGLKVFIEFEKRFYPDAVIFDDRGQNPDESERMYYNVSLDKKSQRHVLGLFAIGKMAEPYIQQENDEGRIKFILKELDAMFGGQAGQYYKKHVTQNWAEEPYIRGAYSNFRNDSAVTVLGRSIEGRVHFAGEAYNLRDNWGYVHTASRAAYDLIERMIENKEV